MLPELVEREERKRSFDVNIEDRESDGEEREKINKQREKEK